MNEKLRNALKVIKKECKQWIVCTNCPLYNKAKDECEIYLSENPSEFKI